MPNPSRKAMGGDVDGCTTTDTGHGLSIKPLQVARASYEPGYDIGYVMDSDGCGITEAELKLGFSSYGRKKIGQS